MVSDLPQCVWRIRDPPWRQWWWVARLQGSREMGKRLCRRLILWSAPVSRVLAAGAVGWVVRSMVTRFGLALRLVLTPASGQVEKSRPHDGFS